MGIYIKGMKMPTSCANCPLRSYDHDDQKFCGVTGNSIIFGLSRPEFCSLTELSPHGRLIDADAMIVSIKRQTGFLKIMGGDLAAMAEVLEKGILQEIENAQTIIEADRSKADDNR